MENYRNRLRSLPRKSYKSENKAGRKSTRKNIKKSRSGRNIKSKSQEIKTNVRMKNNNNLSVRPMDVVLRTIRITKNPFLNFYLENLKLLPNHEAWIVAKASGKVWNQMIENDRKIYRDLAQKKRTVDDKLKRKYNSDADVSTITKKIRCDELVDDTSELVEIQNRRYFAFYKCSAARKSQVEIIINEQFKRINEEETGHCKKVKVENTAEVGYEEQSCRIVVQEDSKMFEAEMFINQFGEVQVKLESEMARSESEDAVDDLEVINQLREQMQAIQRAVDTSDLKLIYRVLRCLPEIRKNLLLDHVVKIGVELGFLDDPSSTYETSRASSANLLSTFEVSNEPLPDPSSAINISNARCSSIPEIRLYYHLLVLIKLLDLGFFNHVVECSTDLLKKIVPGRRMLYPIAAKCFYYFSLSHEVVHKLCEIRRDLFTWLSIATTKKDFESQAVLINCLLRNFLHFDVYEPAAIFASKLKFPEQANTNEWARFHYYIGRIEAVRLEYSSAQSNLQEALKKAPNSAVGFRQTVQRFLVVVQLLVGEIPEKEVFRRPEFKTSLAPYFQLTKAVRLGNSQLYEVNVEENKRTYYNHYTLNLIQRLRNSVIRVAIKRIGRSYTRIKLFDVAKLLQMKISYRIRQKLDNNCEGVNSPLQREIRRDMEIQAEFIIIKAIKDGVIDAVVDSEKKYIVCKDFSIFRNHDARVMFHERIVSCSAFTNQCIRAMEYPLNQKNWNFDTEKERRARELSEIKSFEDLIDDNL